MRKAGGPRTPERRLVRIALLGPGPPFHGGIAGYLARLAAGLAGRGHEVVWSAFRKQYPRILHPGRAQQGGAAAWLAQPQRSLFVAWSPRSWRRTAADLLSCRPDALVLKYWLPFFAPGFRSVARALRRRGVAVVYVVDNVAPHEPFPLARLLTRAALREADGWVLHCAAVQRELEELLPGLGRHALRCVPHPLFDFGAPGREPAARAGARRRLGIPAGARVALCFGYVRPYKGVQHLIEAGGLLARESSAPPRIYIAGEVRGPRAPYLEQIRRAGAERVVELRDGFVPDAGVEDWFVAADAVVLPYETATQSGVERIAARYGVPVVATRVGGLPEVVDEKSGRLVPPGDPRALAAALAEVLGAAGGPPAAVPAQQVQATWDALCAAIEELVHAAR
jgi:glycosyltransferase involved in cell wall biosynthesis